MTSLTTLAALSGAGISLSKAAATTLSNATKTATSIINSAGSAIPKIGENTVSPSAKTTTITKAEQDAIKAKHTAESLAQAAKTSIVNQIPSNIMPDYVKTAVNNATAATQQLQNVMGSKTGIAIASGNISSVSASTLANVEKLKKEVASLANSGTYALNVVNRIKAEVPAYDNLPAETQKYLFDRASKLYENTPLNPSVAGKVVKSVLNPLTGAYESVEKGVGKMQKDVSNAITGSSSTLNSQIESLFQGAIGATKQVSNSVSDAASQIGKSGSKAIDAASTYSTMPLAMGAGLYVVVGLLAYSFLKKGRYI